MPALAASLRSNHHDTWHDDRVSVSPIVTSIEAAVRAPAAVYDAIVEGKASRREVRDVLRLVGLMTGLPAGTAARPIGYLADVASGEEEPTGPVDVGRDLVVGR